MQAVDLNDNSGVLDNHLAMGDGTIEWKPVFLALQNYSVLPQLILEYNTVMPFERLKEGKTWLEKEGF